MDRDRDRSGIPMIELDPKVVGEEVSRSSLVGREKMLVEGSLARRPSPVAGVKVVAIVDGGELACKGSPAFGL